MMCNLTESFYHGLLVEASDKPEYRLRFRLTLGYSNDIISPAFSTHHARVLKVPAFEIVICMGLSLVGFTENPPYGWILANKVHRSCLKMKRNTRLSLKIDYSTLN